VRDSCRPAYASPVSLRQHALGSGLIALEREDQLLGDDLLPAVARNAGHEARIQFDPPTPYAAAARAT